MFAIIKNARVLDYHWMSYLNTKIVWQVKWFWIWNHKCFGIFVHWYLSELAPCIMICLTLLINLLYSFNSVFEKPNSPLCSYLGLTYPVGIKLKYYCVVWVHYLVIMSPISWKMKPETKVRHGIGIMKCFHIMLDS